MNRSQNAVPYRPDYSAVRTRHGDYLWRACAASFLSGRKGAQYLLDEVLRHWDNDKVTPIIFKSAVDPATIGTSGWAGALAGQVVSDAVVGLAPASAGAALISRGLRVTLAGSASITVPTVLTVADDAGGWVSEANPIPVRQVSVTAGPTLEPCKLGVIRVYTNELARYAVQDVEAIMKQTMSQGAALALDAKLFSSDAASAGLSPAGLLNSVTPISATAGGGVSALVKDVAALIAALATAGGGVNPVFIAAPGQAAAIRMWAGPAFTFPVLASAALTAGTIIAVEAGSFVSAFDPVPRFDVRDQAVLHMESAPSALSENGTVAAPTRSLFQTDCSSVKLILRCSFGMRATGHVQVINSVTW